MKVKLIDTHNIDVIELTEEAAVLFLAKNDRYKTPEHINEFFEFDTEEYKDTPNGKRVIELLQNTKGVKTAKKVDTKKEIAPDVEIEETSQGTPTKEIIVDDEKVDSTGLIEAELKPVKKRKSRKKKTEQ